MGHLSSPSVNVFIWSHLFYLSVVCTQRKNASKNILGNSGHKTSPRWWKHEHIKNSPTMVNSKNCTSRCLSLFFSLHIQCQGYMPMWPCKAFHMDPAPHGCRESMHTRWSPSPAPRMNFATLRVCIATHLHFINDQTLPSLYWWKLWLEKLNIFLGRKVLWYVGLIKEYQKLFLLAFRHV